MRRDRPLRWTGLGGTGLPRDGHATPPSGQSRSHEEAVPRAGEPVADAPVQDDRPAQAAEQAQPSASSPAPPGELRRCALRSALVLPATVRRRQPEHRQAPRSDDRLVPTRSGQQPPPVPAAWEALPPAARCWTRAQEPWRRRKAPRRPGPAVQHPVPGRRQAQERALAPPARGSVPHSAVAHQRFPLEPSRRAAHPPVQQFPSADPLHLRRGRTSGTVFRGRDHLQRPATRTAQR
jgi:hypothetical protein